MAQPVASPAGSPTADQQQAATSGGPAMDMQSVREKAVLLNACKDRQQTGNVARLLVPYDCLVLARPSRFCRCHDLQQAETGISRCSSQTNIPASLWGRVCLLCSARTGSKPISWLGLSSCCQRLSLTHLLPHAVQGPTASSRTGQHNIRNCSSVLLI